MACSELPWRPFLRHQACSWTTLRRGNVFYYVYKRFFKILSRFNVFKRFFIFIWTFFYIYGVCIYVGTQIHVCSYVGLVGVEFNAPLEYSYARMVNEREPGAPKQQCNRRYHTPPPVRCLGVTLSIRLSRSLFLTTMCKPDVTHKPEVQNISQHRQWMTKSRPQVTCTKTWWRSDAQFQRYAGGPTNRQTDRQTGAVITTPRSAIGGGVRMLGRYAPRCVAATSRV